MKTWVRSNDGRVAPALKLDEKQHVEEPLLEQLAALGWQVIRLDTQQKPGDSFRSHFGEVVLLPRLHEALLRINPFLRPEQLDEVVRAITLPGGGSLLSNNERVLQLLLENTNVSVNHATGEQSPTVRYVDFRTPANNSFVAISQFKTRIPGTEHYIIADVVLFLNGLPVAVIECKSPKINAPITQAIDQLLRYSGQRGEQEGVPELFFYNQFVVATCRQIAKFGTISTHDENQFYRWLDPYPRRLDDLPHSGTTPNDQQRLVAGMCAPANLLDLIETFTLWSANEKGGRIKVVGRYQQFRAVKLTIERLLNGRNRRERSGIIWHTQGSGKSLTMMFMVRAMRKHPDLSKWKVVFITDRTQLEEQLKETGGGINQTVKVAEWIEPRPQQPDRSLKELLANRTPDVVMGMIQKFQENNELETIFPLLDPSPNILLMIDEAHRTQYKILAANLDQALPNAARVAYTGTPIDKTETTFGDYIDTYTMRESIEDGTTLAIVYEGRTDNPQIPDRAGMDEAFVDVFNSYKLSERLQILGYGAKDAYLEAQDVIHAKARDMLEHYIANVFENGYKAQVVATSREAAVRYKDALDAAIKDKIAELEQQTPPYPYLERLRTMETAAIFSGSASDAPHLKRYTGKQYHSRSIRRFKLPFDGQEEQGAQTIDGRVGIIIVNDMLLTGFDAPIEQVMYLDQVVTGHNLLQAIARVNRVRGSDKDKGFVVDYVGIGNDLKRALDDYAERERDQMLRAISDEQAELGKLVAAHRAIWDLLKTHGLTDLSDIDAFFDMFYDEDIRFAYIVAFGQLTCAFNVVFPRKEALTYWRDYQHLVGINALAQRHFHDERLSMRGIPTKLRRITDEYLQSSGIAQKIAPISILDEEFLKDVQVRRRRDKTRAAEVEHAIRHFVTTHMDDDPELYASFVEALERILEAFRNNWNAIYQELEKLRQCIVAIQKEPTYGLDRWRQMPIFNTFKGELYDNRELNEDEIAQNVNLTLQTFDIITREVRSAGFWDAPAAQNRLKGELAELFTSEQFYSYPNLFKKRQQIISRLLEWARPNHDKIVRG